MLLFLLLLWSSSLMLSPLTTDQVVGAGGLLLSSSSDPLLLTFRATKGLVSSSVSFVDIVFNDQEDRKIEKVATISNKLQHLTVARQVGRKASWSRTEKLTDRPIQLPTDRNFVSGRMKTLLDFAICTFEPKPFPRRSFYRHRHSVFIMR